jgi:nicotinate-nucleotide adenylyltransferase
MTSTSMIGILGGAFDPVHLGHLRMALDAYEKYKLTEIRFIPCALPVHKKTPIASGKQRIAMLKLAIKSHPAFVLDQREINRKTPSYMIETLHSLKSDMPDQSFGLIMGATEMASFTTWRCFEEILTLAKLLIMPRGTANSLPVSSTLIRKILKQNKNPRYLLPDPVLDYIIHHKIYNT